MNGSTNNQKKCNMNIKMLQFVKDNNRTIDIVFIDDDTKEIAGHCNYYVSYKIGYIYDTYLFPEYRNKKIMKSHINDILCDMKLMGAEKVLLSTLSDEVTMVWEKLGFKKINKNNMEMDIKHKEYANTNKFENPEDYEKITELLELYK